MTYAEVIIQTLSNKLDAFISLEWKGFVATGRLEKTYKCKIGTYYNVDEYNYQYPRLLLKLSINSITSARVPAQSTGQNQSKVK